MSVPPDWSLGEYLHRGYWWTNRGTSFGFCVTSRAEFNSSAQRNLALKYLSHFALAVGQYKRIGFFTSEWLVMQSFDATILTDMSQVYNSSLHGKISTVTRTENYLVSILISLQVHIAQAPSGLINSAQSIGTVAVCNKKYTLSLTILKEFTGRLSP